MYVGLGHHWGLQHGGLLSRLVQGGIDDQEELGYQLSQDEPNQKYCIGLIGRKATCWKENKLNSSSGRKVTAAERKREEKKKNGVNSRHLVP